MRKPCIALLMATGTILGSLPESSRAQDNTPVGYVLYRVASGPAPFEGKFKNPTLIEADASGGKAVVEIVFTDKCSEKVEFTWKFDKDIRYLRAEEEFTVTMAGKVSGDCGRDPYATVNTAIMSRGIFKTLTEQEQKGINGMVIAVPQTDAEARMYLKSEGTGSTKMKAAGSVRNAPGLWFSIYLVAVSPREGFIWEVPYLFSAVTKSTKPGDVTIKLDSPAKGSSTTSTVPGSGGVPPTPKGTETGGDPCQDPARQACIDKWLDKLTTILNRNAPDRAPWSISRYGHLVNKQVVSVAPPDGWETKYKSSKHCFVWHVYGNAHTDPLLRGELPALHTECGSGGSGGQPGGGQPGGGQPGGGQPGGGQPGGGTLPVAPGSTATSGRTLLAERRVASPKQMVNVPVRLLNPSGVANVNFEVAYDPAVVVARKVTRGGLLAGPALFESNPNDPGRIRVGFADKAGWSASGIVAVLTFEVIGKPGDRTPLTLTVTDIDDASDKPLPIDLVHGEIVITGPGSRMPGDCDGDGLVTAADALCALKMSVGLRPAMMHMDVNGDNQVTSADARRILQQIP